jgi:hypothetical protein
MDDSLGFCGFYLYPYIDKSFNLDDLYFGFIKAGIYEVKFYINDVKKTEFPKKNKV